MVQAREIPEEEVALLEAKGRRIKGRREYRRLESVLLRAKEGKTAEEIAVILKIHPRTVEKHHERYFKEGLAAFEAKSPGKVGPRLMSAEEEKALFKTLEEKAQRGEWLNAAQVKPLYEEKAGKAIGESTIYKILYRNQWSKKRPRPKHPKGDPEAQSLFKKTPRNHSFDC